MLTFLDGPASGKSLTCARAPKFLRLVLDPDGNLDALDLLTDTPRGCETIHVYVKVEDLGSVHYSGRDRHGKRFGRWEQCASYRLLDQQPADATARDTSAWRAWATARAAEMAQQPTAEEPAP